ncbi:alpha/beta-hydrolase [Wilcoxina mikolae CBS 423.85]|nr:alpha/beta-hydrolase [Wilcoxina mikolae CBS 423.85]
MNLLLPLLLFTRFTWAQDGTPHYRSYFYIGGSYVPSPANASEHIRTEQVYVERLTPISPRDRKQPAILLLHGQAQTGTNFLNTPDNRPGWSSHFLAAGHTVYIADQPLRGRSPVHPASTLSVYSAERISNQFTAPQVAALWPQARKHTQWPGAGVQGDEVFDAYYASNAPFEGNTTLQQLRMRAALVELVEGIEGDVVVVAHSQAGLFAWALADAVGRRRVKGIVALEPTGPPFREEVFSKVPARKWGLTDIPLAYEPKVVDPAVEIAVERVGVETEEMAACSLQDETKTVRRLKILRDVPVLLVTSEASYHAVYDHCTVAFLRQAGVKTEFMRLWERGQRGNGHLMFMEKNSKEVWKLVEEWVVRLK